MTRHTGQRRSHRARVALSQKCAAEDRRSSRVQNGLSTACLAVALFFLWLLPTARHDTLMTAEQALCFIGAVTCVVAAASDIDRGQSREVL